MSTIKLGDGGLVPYLNAGDGVLDIGANNGEYSRGYASAVGPTGHVLGVEPHPDVAQRGRERSEKWPWITIMCACVAGGMGPRTLYVDEHPKRSSLWPANRPNPIEDAAARRAGVVKDWGPSTVETRAVTVDHLAPMVPNLKAIKIDAQGAEGEIMAGASETLQNTAVVWQVEIWPGGLGHAGSSPEAVFVPFEQAGYVPVGATWPELRTEIAKPMSPHGSIDVIFIHE